MLNPQSIASVSSVASKNATEATKSNKAYANLLSWSCPLCTLVNKPQSVGCEVCGTKRLPTSLRAASVPVVIATPIATSSATPAASPSPPPPPLSSASDDAGYMLYTGRVGDAVPSDNVSSSQLLSASRSSNDIKIDADNAVITTAPSTNSMPISYSGYGHHDNKSSGDDGDDVAAAVFTPAAGDPSSLIGLHDVGKRARQIALRFFNIMFGNNDESLLFWKQDVTGYYSFSVRARALLYVTFDVNDMDDSMAVAQVSKSI
jgi:hypothetical protein